MSSEVVAATPALDNVEAAPSNSANNQFSYKSLLKSLLTRFVIIYFISSLFTRRSAPSGDGNKQNFYATNIFTDNTIFDLHVLICDSNDMANCNNTDPIWLLERVHFGHWASAQADSVHMSKHLEFDTPTYLLENGSAYLHVHVVPTGAQLRDCAHTDTCSHTVRCVTRQRRLPHQGTHRNLLTGPSRQAAAEDPAERARVTHWHENVTVNVVYDQTAWPSSSPVVSPLGEHIHFTRDRLHYKPIVYVNDYWNMARDYMPVNASVSTLHLNLLYQPLSLFKFQMYCSMQARNKWMSMFTNVTMATDEVADDGSGGDDEEEDTLKEMLLTTSPVLLAVTSVVLLLHSVFDFLAFKNDIQFWRKRDSLEGLSVRTVLFSVFQASVVLLYVHDQATNFMIRLNCFIGLLIELWKLTKVFHVQLVWTYPLADTGEGEGGTGAMGRYTVPRVTVSNVGSYVQSSTCEYDRLAFRYVSWLVFPLFVGYACYSLIYNEHSGWYSFCLSLLYGFLLTFGFIMMTPQLFINYKLKSVAHLPWRMLTYKALNTFIDDIFAFVIRMPMLHRIGCLRDDVIFFIYLYQRYIYRVDPHRVNEFGYTKQMLDGESEALDDNGHEEEGCVVSTHDTVDCSHEKND